MKDIYVPSCEDILKKARGRYDHETIKWVCAQFKTPIEQLQDRISDMESDEKLKKLGIGEQQPKTFRLFSWSGRKR